ncbi:biotin/lipoyl-binding carrier protein [Metabacillus arenae]|uniref:Biotin/lipoyl-binding carrier protein n=1 Tax=Metabacillus arenae TaxID=2771434 RepID=A0A926NG75_9BACI|nr:biotin/lipoyl-binding carrier protein [Metabacillus arenae]MBD1379918.1 biotin/lipoyl-binding carrier protein [Metabacillus arenae]
MEEMKASMAGTVLNVLANQNDQVAKGQEVIILESMKMEIPVECECDGMIQEIKVSIGDFVNEGDTLFTVAPNS